MSLPSRSRFWSRLGFGSTPGDPEESRAFLQKRIVFFVGIVGLLWLAITVTATVSALIWMPSLLRGDAPNRAGLVHNLGTAGLLVCWAICRRLTLSLRALNWLDAGVTVAQSLVMSAIMDAVDMRFRPDLSMALGLVCTLIGRAAVVPSNGARTLTIGVLASLPVLVATYLAHVRLGAAGLMPAPIATTQIGNWLLFGLLLSTTISRVIYGLAARVQEAQRLGQYTLERKIGAGAMGEVYLARHALLRRPTAVKLLAPGRAGHEALQRFEREVQATSGLRHPHTVAIYDYGRTPEGIFYYAMEYLDGVDLERLIAADGPQPQGRVVRILRQVAGALAEAHAAGLIHRDIKPSNIVLGDHGHEPDFAKVLDFGLVKESTATAGAAASGAAVLTGTPLYMSPEAITAPSSVDGRSDLYALGAVGYALLTGVPPFAGHTAVELYGHHLHTPVTPPSKRTDRPVSPGLERLLLACLEKDRQRRPPSAAAMEEQLADLPTPDWSTAQARAWWDQRGAQLRADRPAAAPAESAATVVVDLHDRARRG